jgi:hypothetical protein
MSRPFRVHRLAIELAGKPQGEIADVDHLLYLAPALVHDLAHLERYQLAQRVLLGA